MESPVRIFLGAAIVVHILVLLTSAAVNESALVHETNPTTVRDEKATKYGRVNSTWTIKHKPKTPDVALNELHPKDSTSEEHTEKNAKYKDRGRVKFHSQLKSSTESALVRIKSTTETDKLIVVTPTAAAKESEYIVDYIQKKKSTQVPTLASSVSIDSDTKLNKDKESGETESDEKEDEEDEDYEDYSSKKYHDSNFFTIPGFKDDDKIYNRDKEDYSTPSFDKFSSYFSKDLYSPKENDGPYKSQDFFDFDSDLTTPKNDFFDQKYRDISSSIMKKLASIKATSQPLNTTNPQKVIKENVGVEKLSKGSPNNNSMVIIKNTKETRLMDNEQAGSVNRELSDVHGTSIYYEMSVLSTETYNINHFGDDDCENETLPVITTASTSLNEEEASLRARQPTISDVSPVPFAYSTIPPFTSPSAIPSLFNTIIPISEQGIPMSTQNSQRHPDKPIKIVSNNLNRNRSYSKRLNFTGIKDSPNSVTQQTDQAVSTVQRPLTRKFYYTTPKIKPIWMAPRRNVTKGYKTTYPTTIYAEHFNIKDKFTSTIRPMLPQRTVLTTFPSEIDPVLQSDIGGVRKVVQSQVISDNTIPSLSKRGSMKFNTSPAPPAAAETGMSDLEIPPTMTAWALASLRSPPPSSSAVENASGSTYKSVDENELQKVSEVGDNKETTTVHTPIVPVNFGALNNDVSKNITEIDQNKLLWKPITSINDVSDGNEKVTKSERLPAESNISLQSSLKPPDSTEVTKRVPNATTGIIENFELKPSWVPAMIEKEATTTEETGESEDENIQPVDATKSTGFESITKLPSGVTTPTDESNDTTTEQSETRSTTDIEITTIRFSYVPTEEITETEAPITNENWHPVDPARTEPTTFDDSRITTYRPKYTTTTETIGETTSAPIDTTPQLEISSQITEKVAYESSETFEETTTTEAVTTSQPTTTALPTTESTRLIFEITPETTMRPEQTTENLITTTYLVETTETSEAPKTTVEQISPEETEGSSEENSDSNEVISQDTTETLTATPISIPSTTSPTEYPRRVTTKASTTTTTQPTTTMVIIEETGRPNGHVVTTVRNEETTTYMAEMVTKSISQLEDLTSYAEDVTTESSSRVLTEEAGSGAAIAIAVSTIGVIALVMLLGLLVVVRRRGRRGVYAQRCTPVSLDAYSLDSVSVGPRKGAHRLRGSKRSYGNPAYDDEVTSHPMQYPALAKFALDAEAVSAEFAEIPTASVAPDAVPRGCEDKNRYSNVLPLPATRVRLQRLNDDPATEYINANYVTGPGNIRNFYIMSQAPMANTVVDFWRMIWEQNSRLIVMLTEYMENGVEKCYEYLPPSEVSDNKRTFGDFQIILKKREQRDKYAISSVQLINAKSRSWREVTHLWYFWPASGVPDDCDSVIDFISEMRSYMKISQTAKEYDEEGVEVIYGEQSRSSMNNLAKLRSDENSSNGLNVYSPAKAEELLRRNNGTLPPKGPSDAEGLRPCAVVCASGAGRAAALVALAGCARALAAGAVDVPRVVRDLRAQRPHALANRHHYLFLYKVLSEYGNKLMGGGVDAI